MKIIIGVQGSNPYLNFLKEILNHQGIIFEEVVDRKRYPCIVRTNLYYNERIENCRVINIDKLWVVGLNH